MDVWDHDRILRSHMRKCRDRETPTQGTTRTTCSVLEVLQFLIRVDKEAYPNHLRVSRFNP